MQSMSLIVRYIYIYIYIYIKLCHPPRNPTEHSARSEGKDVPSFPKGIDDDCSCEQTDSEPDSRLDPINTNENIHVVSHHPYFSSNEDDTVKVRLTFESQ